MYLTSVQFSSVAQSCSTLCNPMNCSTPGLSVPLWLSTKPLKICLFFLFNLACSWAPKTQISKEFIRTAFQQKLVSSLRKGSTAKKNKIFCIYFSSVQFSRSVVSNSLRPHESQHARPPGPSPTPGVHSDSRPLSQWCHPAISSSTVPFSSCPQTLPASESFPMS